MTIRPQPLSALQEHLKGDQIRLVATDMDGTLTANGEFTSDLLKAFEALAQRGIDVMIVTGRSAGWVSALVNYLPVVGAIAENGGIYIDKHSSEPIILPDIPRMSRHRERLHLLFQRLQAHIPFITPATDNAYRLTDWTFDIARLKDTDIADLKAISESSEMGFTYSNVQCHIQIKVNRQNKAAGFKSVLQQKFAHLTFAEILTVGDSPNDESLFDPKLFPHSVGVANVSHYLPGLAHRPAYITQEPEVKGFLEVVQCLLNLSS